MPEEQSEATVAVPLAGWVSMEQVRGSPSRSETSGVQGLPLLSSATLPMSTSLATGGFWARGQVAVPTATWIPWPEPGRI